MKDAVNALVTHLKTAAYTDLSKMLSTVEPYQGQLRDTAKLARSLPAAFVALAKARPFQVTPEYDIDLLVVDDNIAYNQQSQTNLDLVSDLGAWIASHFAFSSYLILAQTMEVDALAITHKTCIYRIYFTLRKV
jgi:hypothetical protein